VSRLAVVQAESEHEEAEAAVQVAEADRDLARLDLESTKVRAPIDGVISRITGRAGEVVRVDTTSLARIVSLDPLYADFFIDEDTAGLLNRLPGQGNLKPGAEAELPILLDLRDKEGFPRRGRLIFVSPEIQPIRETAVQCRAEIPNPDGSLAPGLKARVRMVIGAPHKALLIPSEAVSSAQGKQLHVLVVNAEDILEVRFVECGASYNGLREVTAGLKPDDWVVVHTSGPNAPGQKVVPDRFQLKPAALPSTDREKIQVPRQR
jgi:gold/copper resistance efflux system membrane fusion protein